MRQQVDVAKALDGARLRALQITVIGLCFLTQAIDGFDMLILPNTAPLVLKALHIPASQFGLLVSVSLSGMLISGIIGGLIADKIGRRGLILLGLGLFGVLTIAKAYVTGYAALLALQILTGIGIGLVFINVMALASEYAPARSRRFLVTCVSSAYPLGGVLASYAAASLGARMGWAAVFVAGGIAALIAWVLCFVWLPASARQLVLQNRDPDEISRIMTRIIPMPSEGVEWTTSEDRLTKTPIREVFREGRGTITCILILAVSATLMSGYFVVSWSPLLFTMAGMSASQAAFMGSFFPLGAMMGSWFWGRLTDRFWPPAVLGIASALGAVCYGVIGNVIDALPLLMAVVVVGGFGMGVQNAYYGFVTTVYPTAIRGTALGLIAGVGRLASILSPLLGSVLIAAHWQVVGLYRIPAALLAVGCLCMILANALPASRRSIVSSGFSKASSQSLA